MSLHSLGHAVRLARDTLPPIHPAGRPFVLGGALATLLLRKISRTLGLSAGLGTLATAAFFRDPQRVPPPAHPGRVLSAADGTVSQIDAAVPPGELGMDAVSRPRISVFLSLLDVHVQRLPIDGRVTRATYRPGTFLSADRPQASTDNERNSLVIRTADDQELVVVQIAGLLARRILCQIREGEPTTAGARYGLIRFGSRVDVYLPPGSRVLVTPGQRTLGGETPLATLPTSKD